MEIEYEGFIPTTIPGGYQIIFETKEPVCILHRDVPPFVAETMCIE
jgi:hypothetical protein